MDIDVSHDRFNRINVSDKQLPHIHVAFQRVSDGLVVAVEEWTTQKGRYAITALPQNFRQDDRPIRQHGDDGYFWIGDDRDKIADELERILSDLADE